jgi:predicted Zn-dependent protease
MQKRSFLRIGTLAAIAGIGIVAFVVAQWTGSQKPKAPSGKAGIRTSGASTRRSGPAQKPIRPPDPNRAPQAAVDEALFTNEDFFGSNASVARPYALALASLDTLLTKYPKDPQLRLHAARLSERLGQFDRSAAEMNQYADLKKRSPDALRRLAGFYNHRARFADEVRTLEELAKAVTIPERGPIYKRAAAIVRSYSLKEFKPADFFAELVAADPSNIQPVRDYAQELQLAKRDKDALAVLASFQPKFPSELAYFLKTRAQILEDMGDRRAAEQVYSSAFDPNWPRAVAAGYYELLRRTGRYRTVRRALQAQVNQGTTNLDPVARLFSIFVYEGNYEEASRLLRDLEHRRAGPRASSGQPAGNQTVASAAWPAKELETVADMFVAIGNYDQGSRYLYTLYLTGGLQPASASRENALYRLFMALTDAAGAPTRVSGGDLSFYKDVAEVDQHPGFMNGVLSLILSGSDPGAEFRAEEKSAAGYFNRAFAYRIFSTFKQEYPQSPRLAEIYLGVVNTFAALGEHRLAIAAGQEFQERYTDSPKYVNVSVRIADSYVALKDGAKERALLLELLDRLARNRVKGMPLVPSESKGANSAISPLIAHLVDKISYDIEAYSDTYDPTQELTVSSDESDSEDAETGGGGESEEDSQQKESESAEQGPTYSSLLERYVASLANDDKKKTETVAFFWGQIRKHPGEEGLYERFLAWLGQAQIASEQLNAYNAAIRRFDSNSWYSKLARWYIRQKRGKELAAYSRQLIDIFNEQEITDYLVSLPGYGATSASDEANWDAQLGFQLYSYAHNRFPRNLVFVRGMLVYLQDHDRAAWEKLSTQYYFADRSIREPYLAWLAMHKELRDRYAEAASRVAQTAGITQAGGVAQPPAQTGTAGSTLTGSAVAGPPLPTPGAAPGTLTTYRIFAADAAAWLSYFGRAVDVYRDLVASFPGEPSYSQRLADLSRSFGQQDDGFYDESARVLSHMAEIYPSEHKYRIKAGEDYAERGEFKLAGQQWDKLIELEPGERNTYLEVATVYWDYYQFDQAIRVFKDLRKATGDQTIYAYRLGAVYESKGDINSAIAEYVKVLPEPGAGRDTVTTRLAQLSRRPGLAAKIGAAYATLHAADPNDWHSLIGYALYEVAREHQADALALLRAEIDKSSDVAFLETMRDLFRGILRPEDEQQALTRLTSAARDEHEAMKYNLQLASFLERNSQVDAAIKIIDRLVAEHPTNVGVVEESAQFYWRAALLDRALDLYKRTLAQARGPNRRRLTLELARRQSDAGKPVDAEATLRAFYDENRLDTEVFGELTRVLGAQNKLQELAALYQDAFKDVREAGLVGDDARSRLAELRTGMIRTLTGLGRYQEALDQHIEIINYFPEDADRLTTAIVYAERHGLVDRLVGYYEKLTKQSYKNYRWQIVLGRIYERQNNLAAAAEQYRAAVANEPERADIRFNLASALARQGRYDDAIATLRQGWVLAGRDPQWLIEVARVQLQQGHRDDVVQTMRQALAAKTNASVTKRLAIASQLGSWGFDAEAADIYEQTFAVLPKTLKDEYVNTSEIAGYVRVLIRSAPAATVFQKIEQMRAQYLAIGENSKDTDGYRAKSIVSSLDEAMRSDFGQGVIDYASTAEAVALKSALQASAAGLASYSDRDACLRYLGIARAAGLVDLEEQIQTQLKDAAFTARTKPEDASYYNELRALLAFHNRHAAYARAAELLIAENKRDPYKNRFDYESQIATEYRLAGNLDQERESLGRAYAAASGGIAPNADWVDRYLTLLYSSGRRDEIARLAASYNPHQFQLINFLIERNEKELARTAIENANQSAAWRASRSAEVGLFLKDFSADTEGFFKKALNVAPIGEMLGRRVDSTQTLGGDDWFLAARNYGYWLGLQPKRQGESPGFLAGEIERHPSSAGPHLELAAFFLDRKNPQLAAGQTALAAELAPRDKEVTIMQGTVAFARNDKKAAIDTWAALISAPATVADAQSYTRVMADHGLLRDALPPLADFIVNFIEGSTHKAESSRAEAVKPLLRDIAVQLSADGHLGKEQSDFFHTVLDRTPEDASIGRMLIEEKLVPEAMQGSIYRMVHQRLSDMAAAVFGTSEYENGYYSGDQFVYPAKQLSQWRRKLLDYLIRTGSLDEARLLIATIKREQSDLKIGTVANQTSDGSSESGTTDLYDWLPQASALIELREGDPDKAVAELRSHCGLGSGKPGENASQADDGTLHPQCLEAYALLVAEHKETEAEALLYDAYRAAVTSRSPDDLSLTGLAEIEARRGRADEAARLLKMLVERSTDNLKALHLAAETAVRIARYDVAIEYMEHIARANPGDSTNALELGRVLAAAGRNGDAVDRLTALASLRATPNTVRAEAAEVIGQISSADPPQATRTQAALQPKAAQGDAGASLILAAIAEATGNANTARASLSSITSGPLAAVAQLKLGTISMASGRDQESVGFLEQALYLDTDGAVTDAISFKVPSARVQLTLLYSRLGRDLAAVRMAEDQEKPLVSKSVRDALASEAHGAEPQESIVFEPPLQLPRLKGADLKPLADLRLAAAAKTEGDILAALVGAATRLGQYDKAIAIERLRVAEALRAEEKAAIEKTLADLMAANKARQIRTEALWRLDHSNTTSSIYAEQIIGR